MILTFIIIGFQALELGFAIGLVAGYVLTIFTLVLGVIMGIKGHGKKYTKEVLYRILFGGFLFVFFIGFILTLMFGGDTFLFFFGCTGMTLLGFMAIAGLLSFLFPFIWALF